MPEAMSNQLSAEIARYQKQMMDYYEIGRQKNPDYDQDTAAANGIPNQTSEPPIAGSPDLGGIRPALIPDSPPWSPEMEQAYRSQYPETGYLKTSVTTARGAIPLKDAQVTIYKTIDGMTKIFAHGLTDESGEFPSTALPAPPKGLSSTPTPGQSRPFATYNIVVTYPDYVPVKIHNVPVFEGIVSLQSVNMIPQSAAQSLDQVDEIFEREPTL